MIDSKTGFIANNFLFYELGRQIIIFKWVNLQDGSLKIALTISNLVPRPYTSSWGDDQAITIPAVPRLEYPIFYPYLRMGVTAALLKQHEIMVFDENHIDEALNTAESLYSN